MSAFQGRTILVTGASSGIGKATAIKLAEKGAMVIVAARRAAQSADVVDEIEAAGGAASFVAVDISDPSSIDKLFETIESQFGRLDGAFNNAGVGGTGTLLPDTDPAAFEAIFDINVRGTWLCMHHELRLMRAQSAGVILNTSSVAGLAGVAKSSVYSASKHAIIGMTKSAALEYANQGIRVNCLSPGAVKTDMADRLSGRLPGGEATLINSIPMRRLGTPEELAEVAVWLLSNLASYITGATITADGGLTA